MGATTRDFKQAVPSGDLPQLLARGDREDDRPLGCAATSRGAWSHGPRSLTQRCGFRPPRQGVHLPGSPRAHSPGFFLCTWPHHTLGRPRGRDLLTARWEIWGEAGPSRHAPEGGPCGEEAAGIHRKAGSGRKLSRCPPGRLLDFPKGGRVAAFLAPRGSRSP